MRPDRVQAHTEAACTEGLESEKPRIFQWPVLLREGVAAATAQNTRHDTRQDTPFKVAPEADPLDTGRQNGGDTRRDTAQKG